MVPLDLPAVMEIEQASFSNPWTRRGFLAALDQANVAAYVCALGRQVIAYFVLSFEGREAHIMNLAVHPDYRRHGIATDCLHFIDRVAQRWDSAQITLEVEESNLAAQLCYKKAGYRGTRVLRNYYPDTQEDGYRMVRKLPDPARATR